VRSERYEQIWGKDASACREASDERVQDGLEEVPVRENVPSILGLVRRDGEIDRVQDSVFLL